MKKSVETPEIEVLGEAAMSKTEMFFENNGRKITFAIVVLFVVAAGLFGYKTLVMEPKEERAAEAIYAAQAAFEMGGETNFKIALEGDPRTTGFLQVIEEYGSTEAGNLACHYAGVAYMKLGDFDNAAKYLKMYSALDGVPAEIINAQNIGLQGDIAVEKGDFAGAVALFEKAAGVSDNTFTAPLYLRKAGQAAQAAGQTEAAKALYEKVINIYPSTAEARTATKNLGTIK